MNESVRFTLLYAARVLVYAGLMYLINAVFLYDAAHPTVTGKFGEVSMTEITQEIFLFVLGVIFIVIGRLDKQLAPAANLVSVFFFMSFIREFNNQIDFWFYLVLPLLLLFVWLLFRNRKNIFQSLQKLIEIPYTAYLVAGFLVTFVFSRLFGRTILWQAILEDDYNRWAKNAAEEGTELLGYALFLIAGIEILLAIVRHRNAGRKR